MGAGGLGFAYGTIYARLAENVARARVVFGRPLTLAEKILAGHSGAVEKQRWARGDAMLKLWPDRVALQDATAQMTLLQFMQSERNRVAIPVTIHCDHLIQASSGAERDLANAYVGNREVYGFLETAAAKYGIGFWKAGSGIIHQVVLERYAFPGGLMIGTDSHTPNAGGLGMIAIGVGGADAAEVMAGLSFEVLHPHLIGVKLTGSLNGWASAKDVIIRLCKILTTKGGTNKIIEYFGPGTRTLSTTAKATMTNMGAELGATSSVFPFDMGMVDYLSANGRGDVADAASNHADLLSADPEVLTHPEKYFDQVIEIDLSDIRPSIAGPHKPDRVCDISELAAIVSQEGWPDHISACHSGSCTNSSYQDAHRLAHIFRQALQAGLKLVTPFFFSPGSARTYETLKQEGIMDLFSAVGATILASGCGPCIGQWKRHDKNAGGPNVIVSSFNRNFPGRNDGNEETLSFLASPEVVAALAFGPKFGFNPLVDELELPDGSRFRFTPPSGPVLPADRFVQGDDGYVAPPDDGSSITIVFPANSDRLQPLQPFPVWDGKDYERLPILVKSKGETTTDHISPGGKWLDYRGNLHKISENMLLGAVNAFTGETGKGTHPMTREQGVVLSQVARSLQAQGSRWVIIGGFNYGEGSSREHAAMSPRYLGCAAVLAKSYARIHEKNLKRQGVLPLIFIESSDYDLFEETDSVSIVNLADLTPDQPVRVWINKASGQVVGIYLRHTLTSEQIDWFKAGSSLQASKVSTS